MSKHLGDKRHRVSGEDQVTRCNRNVGSREAMSRQGSSQEGSHQQHGLRVTPASVCLELLLKEPQNQTEVNSVHHIGSNILKEPEFLYYPAKSRKLGFFSQ